MKHLLLLAVVIVAFQAIATSAIDTILFKQHGSIQYSDGVLSNDIIEQLKLDMSLSEQQQSHRGHVMVDHNIFQRIKDVAGSAIDINDLIDANTGGVKLQTRFINESTQPHVDRYHHNNEVVDDDVMFVALDSNPEAHFTHGDSSIPAVAGRLFRFNGSIKHGTNFNGGNPIRLLGPFSTKNFASVGNRGVDCVDRVDLCFDGVPSSGTISTPGEGSCPGGANPDEFDECYELLDGTGAGNCSSGTGVCVFEGDTFSSFGDGSPCSNSDCFVCTNRAGTCPPPTTSTMATTTAAATTQATTTTSTQSKSGKTTSAKAKSVKTSKEDSPGLDDLIADISAILFILFSLLTGNSEGMDLGAMLEDIQAEGGGIRGRRILEDKEDIKALFVSLLEEKMDSDEY